MGSFTWVNWFIGSFTGFIIVFFFPVGQSMGDPKKCLSAANPIILA